MAQNMVDLHKCSMRTCREVHSVAFGEGVLEMSIRLNVREPEPIQALKRRSGVVTEIAGVFLSHGEGSGCAGVASPGPVGKHLLWQGEAQEGGAGSMSPWPWACLYRGPHGCLPDCPPHRSSLLGWAGVQVSISTLLGAPSLEPLVAQSHWILHPLGWDIDTTRLCPGFSVSRRVSVTGSQLYDTATGIQPRGHNPEEATSRDTSTGSMWVLVANLMSYLLDLAKYSLGSWVSSRVLLG